MAVGNPVAGDRVPKTLRDKFQLTCIRFSSRWARRLLGKWLAVMALGVVRFLATPPIVLGEAAAPVDGVMQMIVASPKAAA